MSFGNVSDFRGIPTGPLMGAQPAKTTHAAEGAGQTNLPATGVEGKLSVKQIAALYQSPAPGAPGKAVAGAAKELRNVGKPPDKNTGGADRLVRPKQTAAPIAAAKAPALAPSRPLTAPPKAQSAETTSMPSVKDIAKMFDEIELPTLPTQSSAPQHTPTPSKSIAAQPQFQDIGLDMDAEIEQLNTMIEAKEGTPHEGYLINPSVIENSESGNKVTSPSDLKSPAAEAPAKPTVMAKTEGPKGKDEASAQKDLSEDDLGDDSDDDPVVLQSPGSFSGEVAEPPHKAKLEAGVTAAATASVEPATVAETRKKESESTKNALKDFILHNTAFEIPETNGKIVPKKVEAGMLARGIAAVYQDNLQQVLPDLVQLMRENSSNKEVCNRILDFVGAMLDSHLNDQLLRSDWQIKQTNEQKSNLKQIVILASANPELSKEVASIMKKCASIPQSNQFEGTPEHTAAFNGQLNAIRGGVAKKEDVNALASKFASDSKDYFTCLYRNCNTTDFMELKRGGGGKAAHGDNTVALTSAFNKLTNSVKTEILKGNSLQECTRIIQFYTKVATAALKEGDYATAFAIHLSLADASVNRLKDAFSKLDATSQAELTHLQATLDNTKNYKGYKDDRKKFESYIPIPMLLTQALVFLGETPTYVSTSAADQGEIKTIPNYTKIQTTANTYATELEVVARVKIGSCNQFPGFLSLADSTVVYPSDKDLYAKSLQLQPRK